MHHTILPSVLQIIQIFLLYSYSSYWFAFLRAEHVICPVTLHQCGVANAAGSRFLAQAALTHRNFLNITLHHKHHNSVSEPSLTYWNI
jgi:hypothetical protein